MKYARFLGVVAVMTGWTGVITPARGQPPPTPRVPLPFDVIDTMDGATFQIRVPANWNGKLLIWNPGTRTGPAPPVPRVVPPVLPPTDTSLEGTLLGRGYALASSLGADTDWQLKANVQDTLSLTAYFRGRVGSPSRVIVWGTSLGGLSTLRLIEDFPRSFDGAIPLCSAAAGEPRRLDSNLDFILAYAAAFGWNESAWGPIGNVKPGLVFPSDIAPLVDWPKPDGSNTGGWEFIRLVNGIPTDVFWNMDPGLGMPGYRARMLLSLWQLSGANRWAGGAVAQNLDHRYELTIDEKRYLLGLGVQPNVLLAMMNREDVAAVSRARDFVRRFGDVRGTLTKPALTVHTILDPVADIRNEGAYRKTVEEASALNYLAQAFVASQGHCAFTSNQLLAAIAALESWLDTGRKPGASAFPEALGFTNSYTPPPWPWPSAPPHGHGRN